MAAPRSIWIVLALMVVLFLALLPSSSSGNPTAALAGPVEPSGQAPAGSNTQGPPCDLLRDSEAAGNLSGGAESHLRARCGGTAPSHRDGHPPRQVPPFTGGEGRSGNVPPFAADRLVNDRASDRFPHTTQSETSIATVAQSVLVGYNDSGAGAGVATAYSRSANGGVTWTDMGRLPHIGPVTDTCCDPVVVADRVRAEGQTAVFYFASVASTGIGRSIISVHKTIDGGASWVQAANASPLAGDGQRQDKDWMAVDTRPSGLTGAGNVYVCWRRFGGGGGIQFARSTNGGVSFTQLAGNLSMDAINVQGCTIAVNPGNGQVYMAWVADLDGVPTIRFRRSLDFGVSFGPELTVGTADLAEVPADCGGITRPAFVDTQAGASARTIRSIPLPDIAVNPANGQIYLAWHRAGLSGGAAADIAFSRSTDGGATFSAPARSNAVTSGDQFFPSIAVNAQGRIKIMYYSTQNDPTRRYLDVYETVSDDAGSSFGFPIRVTDVSFDRPQTNPNFDPDLAPCYMGDYLSIRAPAPGLGGNDFSRAWGDNRLDANPDPAVFSPDPDIRFARDPGR